MASYKILLHRKVREEDTRHFDSPAKEKIKSACFKALSEHPEKSGEPLRRELARYRKLRLLDGIRVIYRVNRQRRQVLILAVGMRRNEEVYKEALKRLKND